MQLGKTKNKKGKKETKENMYNKSIFSCFSVNKTYIYLELDIRLSFYLCDGPCVHPLICLYLATNVLVFMFLLPYVYSLSVECMGKSVTCILCLGTYSNILLSCIGATKYPVCWGTCMHFTLSKSLDISESPSAPKYIICLLLWETVCLCSQYSSMWLCFVHLCICLYVLWGIPVWHVCMNIDAFNLRAWSLIYNCASIYIEVCFCILMWLFNCFIYPCRTVGHVCVTAIYISIWGNWIYVEFIHVCICL